MFALFSRVNSIELNGAKESNQMHEQNNNIKC